MMKGQKGYALVQSEHSVLQRLWRSVRSTAGRWYELHRQRQQLAQMSDEALKDLGLSRADVYQETEQHFWRDTTKR